MRTAGLSLSLLGLMAVPTTLVRAEGVASEPAFQAQRISAAKQDEVLRSARCLQHSDGGRRQVTGETLREMGAWPTFSLGVDNAIFYLTPPFAFYDHRQIAVAFIEIAGDIDARVLYRSNSQFTWRVCDAMNEGHIGKGFHEFDKQLPIPVTVALLQLHNQVAELRGVSSDGQRSQLQLALTLLHGLTEDGRPASRSDRVLHMADGNYVSREYAAHLPAQPLPFSRVGGWLATAGNSQVADCRQVELPPAVKLPDTSRVVYAFEFHSPAYAELNEMKGTLAGKVFHSRDDSVRYLFFEDSAGRAVLSGVESLRPEINAFGLRSRYLDVTGMDAPLMEYYLQIPAAYGGARRPGYRHNWNYVREQPIIKYYYDQQSRAIPPALDE